MLEKNMKEPILTQHRILKVNMRRNSIQSFDDDIVVESRISLYINSHHYSIISLTPFEIKEFTVGHLIAEGIINKLDEIVELKIDKKRVDVQLNIEPRMGETRIISIECGSKEIKINPQLWMKLKKQISPGRFFPQAIMKAVRNLNLSAETYRKTGGTHAAAIMDKQGCILAVSEDISRHCAVDKVIGKAALQDLNFKEVFLTSTGRVTSGIIIKTINVGIPLIVSLSAPTDKGIRLANMMELTLIGFARGARFNIYTHPERIILH